MLWIDDRLAGAGLERTREPEQGQLRPWATVLRVPSTGGPVWFKATAPGTAFEAALYELLARAVPEYVLIPVATDPARGWILLPDGGPSLGELEAGRTMVDALVGSLVQYARLQRALEPHVDELLAIGVSDMRPAAMPARFEQALEAIGTAPRALTEMDGTVASWCERGASVRSHARAAGVRPARSGRGGG